MKEFIKVPKEEWEQHRKDIELFIERYKESIEKVKDLTKENTALKQRLRSAEEKVVMVDQQTSDDLEQTSEVLKKMRTDISSLLEQTKKEMK